MAPSSKDDNDPHSPQPDYGDERSGDMNERFKRDAEWLCSLSEPELDLLISLKELATRRAKTAGHGKLAEHFDLKTLRALGFVLLEHFKESAQRASVIPDNAEVSKLFDECGLATLNNKTCPSSVTCSEGVPTSNLVTPRRKRLWEGLHEEGQSKSKKQRTKQGT